MKKLTTTLFMLFCLQFVACNVHPTFSNRDEAAAEVDQELVQAGRRNFWEVNAAMAMVTGVDPQAHLMITASENNTAVIKNEDAIASRTAANKIPDNISPSMRRIFGAWQDVNSMMSRKNAIDNCDPATQVGVFRLASAYCDRLVNDTAAWNNFLDKNFAGAQLSGLSSTQIATTMLDALQTGSSLNQEQQKEAVATIVGYIDDNGGASVSQETVFDVCTMILSSAGALVN